MSKTQIEIPVDEDRLAIIYTYDVCTDEELNIIKEIYSKVDWNGKYIIVPSEYIKGIKFIRRRLNRV